MVHTLPPWTSKWRMATIFGQIDQGELAARLGSINTFDRRGDTVWMDDFESSLLKWEALTDGTGSSVTLVSEYARSGSNAVKLVSGDATAESGAIERKFPLPVDSKIGAELHFVSPDDDGYIYLRVRLYTGSWRYQWSLIYDHKNKIIKIVKGNGADVNLAAITLPYSNYLFHSMKLVMDYSDHTYIRAIVNNVEYDVSAYSSEGAVDAVTDPHIVVKIWNVALKNANITAYIDDFILTQNEE